MKKRKALLCLLIISILTGCASESSAPLSGSEFTETAAVLSPVTDPPVMYPAASETAEPRDLIDSMLEQMTLRQKVGQLFIIRPDSLDLSLTQAQINDAGSAGVTELTDAMAKTMKDYPVGGIAMFGKNIESPDQITEFIGQLQTASDVPLFICVDEEGGLIARLANHSAFDLPQFGSAASVGASGDTLRALDMGRTIGAYLRQYGFNMDFAPVADVNTNPDNPIIGTRAFSSDPEVAGQMAAAMAEGLREETIIPVFKHFPGHGDTAEDSHYGLAVSYKTEEELSGCEWIPFEAAGNQDLVMIGHIALPNVLNGSTPSSMSREIVTDILKTQLGFQGLVITDSLTMEAITDLYDSGEAALSALRAGCDLLLMPNGLREAFDAVAKAVENGDFSEAQLNSIVGRILRFKANHGLLGIG